MSMRAAEPWRSLKRARSGQTMKIGPGEWAPAIAGLVGAGTYVNPIGGRALFKTEDFERRGVRLEFLKTEDFVYETGPFAFIPNLSIIDVLMWNSPDAVRKALTTVATAVKAES